MRILAIDFGEKRIGLALSDPAGRLALPLTTLARSSDRQAVDGIREIAERHGVERLVIGEPINLDGSRGPAARRVERFAQKLEAVIGLHCERVDESLTSVEARERLQLAGVDLERDPGRIDAVAAQILLEQYLEGVESDVEGSD